LVSHEISTLGKGWEKVEKRLKDVDFPTISQPFPKVFGGESHRSPTSIDICELGLTLTPVDEVWRCEGQDMAFGFFQFTPFSNISGL